MKKLLKKMEENRGVEESSGLLNYYMWMEPGKVGTETLNSSPIQGIRK